MKRQAKREAEEWASVRPVLMQFRHDDVAKCWRVTFRPRGSEIALPRVLHFGDAEKLRTMFQRFATRRMAEDVAALEFGIRVGRGAVELLLGRAGATEAEDGEVSFAQISVMKILFRLLNRNVISSMWAERCFADTLCRASEARMQTQYRSW